MSIISVQAQNMDDSMVQVDPPNFTAKLSMGFNYDFLKSPLDVSFDYPKAYIGLNIPLKYSPDASLTGDLTKDLSGQFTDSAEFVPQATAKQNPNASIKIDVPMFGGVATFSNMQMMYLRYANMLGAPHISLDMGKDEDVRLFMNGILSVPIDLSVGWETMTFGYAFQINDKLSLALNLHRHTFNFDLKGKIDIDLLGYFTIQMDDDILGGMKPEEISYSLHNVIDGHYEAEAWSPTFAIKFWRASLISRFGMNTKPHGYLKAEYSLPFFLDPETFTPDDALMNEDSMTTYLINNMDRFLNNETNRIVYSTTKEMTWKMPQAHTLQFEIIRDKFSISYTKLFGDIEMSLYDTQSDSLGLTDSTNYTDTLDFRFKAHVDHMIMLHGSFWNTFFNIGIYSMDFSFRDNEHMLSKIEALESLKFGNGIMAPVLNLGAVVGTKIQVQGELDILPLLALKLGLIYYF